MRSRREFIQLASISAMLFASRPWSALAAKQQLKTEDLLKFDTQGQVTLLHITDISWGRVNHPEEVLKLDEKINEMVQYDGPVIFDCHVDPNENCFPMIPSGKPHNQMILGPSEKDENKITGKGKALV